ncbi:MAG: FmdB family zinc ribbon protein [Bacillota bacterium]
MPTYDYKCPKCGVFEQFQAITEKPLEQCPDCHNPVQRLISKNVGIMFKGSGFYVTDNRKSGSGEEKPAKKDDSASSPPTGVGQPAAAS